MPSASAIAPVITGVVTGALTLFTVMAFDRLRESFAFQNKQLADVHRGQGVGLLKIKQSMFMHRRCLSTCHRHHRNVAYWLCRGLVRSPGNEGRDHHKSG